MGYSVNKMHRSLIQCGSDVLRCKEACLPVLHCSVMLSVKHGLLCYEEGSLIVMFYEYSQSPSHSIRVLQLSSPKLSLHVSVAPCSSMSAGHGAA